MSGGSMNYVYCDIDRAANAIQRVLAEYSLRKARGVLVQPSDCDIIYHPDETHLHTPEALMDAVISRLETCLEVARMAAVCAERVEMLDSGDDGEASFCHRLDDELAKVKKTGGVE